MRAPSGAKVVLAHCTTQNVEVRSGWKIVASLSGKKCNCSDIQFLVFVHFCCPKKKKETFLNNHTKSILAPECTLHRHTNKHRPWKKLWSELLNAFHKCSACIQHVWWHQIIRMFFLCAMWKQVTGTWHERHENWIIFGHLCTDVMLQQRQCHQAVLISTEDTLIAFGYLPSPHITCDALISLIRSQIKRHMLTGIQSKHISSKKQRKFVATH